MPRTPDRTPGASVEEELQFEDRTADGNPTVEGAVRYVNSDLVAKVGGQVKSLTASASSGDDPDSLFNEINETSFDEYIYVGNSRRVSSIITWASSAKVLKIREAIVSYAGRKVSTITEIQYDGAGVEVERNVETLQYSGRKLQSVGRVHI